MKENTRYNRQITLPEIGEQGQKSLSRAAVLCVGAGGLGCPALLYLAGAGVGRIGVVDFDVVDETNLQRQILFTTNQVGVNKAQAAKDRLQALNPDIDVQAYPIELTNENVLGLFESYDVIIDGTDNFSTKFLINDAAVKNGKPFIYGSISGFDGQVSIFNYKESSCYRCLFPKTPKEHIPNCTEIGIIGAVAGIIGATQAMEAIKVIVGHKNFQPLINKIWTINTLSLENNLLSLSKNPNCSTCSKPIEDIKLEYNSSHCAKVLEVTIDEVQSNKAALLIDVREEDEWNEGHIEGAQHIALSALMKGDQINLPKDRDIILYCQKGVRGKQAAAILQTQGYVHIFNVRGGYDSWLCKA